MKLLNLLPVVGILFLTSFFEFDARAGSWCCYHHGGPRYCDSRSQRMICMDSRVSPSQNTSISILSKYSEDISNGLLLQGNLTSSDGTSWNWSLVQ